MSTAPINTEKSNKPPVKGYDFKHATYARSNNSFDDVLVIKENIHHLDGRIEPNVRLIKNFKRDFYITKEAFRNHDEKKEWEELDKLRKYSCTQAELPRAVARALNKPLDSANMRQLSQSLWLYGTDIPVTSIVKDKYRNQWPDCIGTSSTVAVLDTETDVVIGHGQILSVSLTIKSQCYIAITKEFIGSIPKAIERLRLKFTEYLGEYEKNRNITLHVHIGETSGACVKWIMDKAHAIKPDFIALWNMAYDLPRMEAALQADGMLAEDVFSDPVVPPEFRKYKFIEGPTHMVTASGKPKKLLPAERWHNVVCTSSFYFIDAMCLYKRIRISEGNETSYSLDNILNIKLGIRKLKFDEVKATGLRWHQIMQSEYKLEYLVYNLFDCISMELLDEKTGDVCRAFPALCGISDFSRFKSNPKRIVDDLHFYCLKQDKVISTFSDNVTTELDNLVVTADGWVTTLPCHLLDNSGIPIIKEIPSIISNVRFHTAD